MAKKGLKYFLIASCAASLFVTSSSAYAVDDDVKAVLGGVLGAIIVEGMKNSNAPAEEQQQENIQWNESQKTSASRPSHDRIMEIERISSIQIYLYNLGFYEGSTDGESGPKTRAAIAAWEKEFQQTQDGKISDKELKFLEELSNKQFSTYNEYKAAAALGFDDADSYRKAKQLEAQSFLEVTDKFLKSYDGDVDLALVSKNLKIIQDSEEEGWTDETQEALDELKFYVTHLQGFEEFQEQERLLRLEESRQRKAQTISSIRSYYDFSDYFLKNNIMDSRAVGFSDGLRSLEFKESDEADEDSLNATLDQVETLLSQNRLSGEYRNWKYQRQEAADQQAQTRNQGEGVKGGAVSADGESYVRTKSFEIFIDNIRTTQSVGDGMFFSENAGPGAVYIIVGYKIKNIGSKPVNAFSIPRIFLLDAARNRYSEDIGAGLAYATQVQSTNKSFSNLNPGITVNDFAVFQVNQALFDKNTWKIFIDADENVEIAIK